MAALPDELYTAAQVRVLDRRAIAAGTPGIVLMRRAAAAVLAELQCRWPSCKSVLVCCGGGNNGSNLLSLSSSHLLLRVVTIPRANGASAVDGRTVG